MIGWALSVGVGVVGLVVLRAWRKEAALSSGEVMDVRDLLPEGQGDCLVRVLGERLYRVDVQLEAVIAADAAPSLPCRLTITRANEQGDEEGVFEATRPLVDLLPLAAGRGVGQAGALHYWGSFPLLEFSSEAIARMRFEVELPMTETVDGREVARIDKANLVVKENVRPLVVPARLLARVAIPSPTRA